MKYAIIHGKYNIHHAVFYSYEEAKEYYDHLIETEGDLNDFTLCKILESHEAPEQEHIPYKSHYGVDMDEGHKNWLDIMRKLNDNWMNRGEVTQCRTRKNT